MKRSEINAAVCEARTAFEQNGWALPPNPRWDVTDFGLGEFARKGLTLVNLAEQAEYCEKIMYAAKDQLTPSHYHAAKKEDIICRWGQLAVRILSDKKSVRLQVNGEEREIACDVPVILDAGERITLTPDVRHEFWPESEYAIIGEVSTANDDLHDNYFDDDRIGRFSGVEEDEPAIVTLVSD